MLRNSPIPTHPGNRTLTPYLCRPHHYRYRFQEWGIKKRTTSKEKDHIINAYGKRSQPGSSRSQVSIHEGGFRKSVDTKALNRYIGDRIRLQDDFQIDYGK